MTAATRRQVLSAAAAVVGAGSAGVVLSPWLATAEAEPAKAASSTAASPAAPPSVYGTPTDLAHAHTEQAWTREADGSVWTYDRTARYWHRWRDQHWTTVLTYGTAVVAHWGKPSGPFQSVMVFGKAPSGGGTPTPPPGGGGTPKPPTPPGGGLDQGTDGNGYNRLAYTGFDAEKYGLLGAAVLAAGAVLTRWAHAPRPTHAGPASVAASASAAPDAPETTAAVSGPDGAGDRANSDLDQMLGHRPSPPQPT